MQELREGERERERERFWDFETRVTCTGVCAMWVLSVSYISLSGLCTEYWLSDVLSYLALVHFLQVVVWTLQYNVKIYFAFFFFFWLEDIFERRWSLAKTFSWCGKIKMSFETRVTCTAACAVWVLSVSYMSWSGLCSEYWLPDVLGYLTLAHFLQLLVHVKFVE